MKDVEFLAKRWQSNGLTQGNTVLIHSNILRTLGVLKKNNYKPSVETIIESFLYSVGKEGTILFPLFNFNFTKNSIFNINSTESQMGSLTEVARKKYNIIRTGHPIYSFGVIGKYASNFKNIDNISGYGSDSPFALLLKLNGKIAVLDLEENESMTFYHHVEEMHDINYRYHKNFTGEYINREGILSKRTYSIFVRDLDKSVKTNINPTGELLWENGLYKGDRPFVNSGLRTIDANKLYDFISNIIIDGEALGKLYEIGN
tara:strand:- start:3620 stop:4399 length:780 start_codon:yes stop_codon:yes gene_type:complete